MVLLQTENHCSTGMRFSGPKTLILLSMRWSVRRLWGRVRKECRERSQSAAFPVGPQRNLNTGEWAPQQLSVEDHSLNQQANIKTFFRCPCSHLLTFPTFSIKGKWEKRNGEGMSTGGGRRNTKGHRKNNEIGIVFLPTSPFTVNHLFCVLLIKNLVFNLFF